MIIFGLVQVAWAHNCSAAGLLLTVIYLLRASGTEDNNTVISLRLEENAALGAGQKKEAA